MSRLALTIVRLCLSAWVGAATLFVIDGIRLVTFPEFSGVVRNQLALIRFPAFYGCGFLLVGLATTLLLFVGRSPQTRSRKTWVAFGLGCVALSTMVIDYLFIYRPMRAMLTPVESARPPEFDGYHYASETINTFSLALILTAALLINWPQRRSN